MLHNELNKFNSLKPRKGPIKDNILTVSDNASELFNEDLETYFDQYMDLSDAEKESWILDKILVSYILKYKVLCLV